MKSLYLLSLGFLFPFLMNAQPTFGGESVEYDPVGKRWFTSDDGTSIIQRDSNGVVSYFGTGLQASHGMEVVGNVLFACNGSTIYGYDLTTEMQVMSVGLPGASFLNGLTSDGGNRLWATDFSAKTIWEIDVTSLVFPSPVKVVSNTVNTPNGIVYDPNGNRLVFVCWGTNAPIREVDLTNYSLNTLTTTSVGNIDGIDEDSYGNYYISAWSPASIIRYDTAFSGPGTTIAAPGINSPADICYARSIDTLCIPNGNNTVTCIGFEPMLGRDLSLHHEVEMTVYPNPAQDAAYLRYTLPGEERVRIELFDLQGRKLRELVNSRMHGGDHYVLLTALGLPRGSYMLRLQAGETIRTEQIILQ